MGVRNRVAYVVAVVVLVASACAADDPLTTTAGDDSLCTEIEPGDHEVADDDHAAADSDHLVADDDHEVASEDHAALSGADVKRTFEVEMSEFAYSCELPELPAGTVVALHFTNVGLVEHEAVVGDLAAQDRAEQAMAAMTTGDGHGGHDGSSITVPAGEEAELIVRLDDPGELMIGCHIPGHWDAGMRTEFRVGEA